MRVAPDPADLLIAGSRALLNATVRSCAVRHAWLSLGLLMAGGAASRMLYAASAAPFAAPLQQSTPSSAGGLLRVVLALIVVLAAVFAAAWLGRRMRAFSGSGAHSSLEMLAQLPLGTRERAVLVRVGDRQLLLGVAPGNVRTLHVLEPAAAAPRAAPAPENNEPATDSSAIGPAFKALLLKSLGK